MWNYFDLGSWKYLVVWVPDQLIRPGTSGKNWWSQRDRQELWELSELNFERFQLLGVWISQWEILALMELKLSTGRYKLSESSNQISRNVLLRDIGCQESKSGMKWYEFSESGHHEIRFLGISYWEILALGSQNRPLEPRVLGIKSSRN